MPPLGLPPPPSPTPASPSLVDGTRFAMTGHPARPRLWDCEATVVTVRRWESGCWLGALGRLAVSESQFSHVCSGLVPARGLLY